MDKNLSDLRTMCSFLDRDDSLFIRNLLDLVFKIQQTQL